MATTYDKASLVMIPSGYKDDKLYSVKPTDGSGDFTFSRDGAGASPATRVNATGLIEKGRTNELLQSNTFSTTWANASTTETGGQSGYDGSSDAWLLDKSAANGRIVQTISFSGVQTFSVYAKAGSLNFMLLMATTSGGDRTAYFNLSTGAVGSGTNVDANIVSIGGGWYRCSVTFSESTNGLRIYPADGDGDTSGTSGNIYIQDAQLEQGLVATDYIETTTAPVSAGLLGDMPRLDYSGGATCPSLLLEPSRVNNLPYSEYFGASDWIKNNASVTQNAATSPSGGNDASLLIGNGISGAHFIYDGINVTSGTAYAFSLFAKAGTNNFIQLFGGVSFGSTAYVNYDLSDGTIGTIGAGVTSGSAFIEPVSDGWYRIGFVANATLTGLGNFVPTLITSKTAAFAEVNTLSTNVQIWGAQFEASASYPTSYIPTYGSASTRGADACNDSTASSLIGASEGVMFLDADLYKKSETEFYYAISDGTLGNSIYLHQASQALIVNKRVSSVTEFVSITSGNWTSGRNKVAIKYTSSEMKVFVNGVLEGTTSITGIASGLDSVTIGSRQDALGSLASNAIYKQALLFTSALTDAECIALTTL